MRYWKMVNDWNNKISRYIESETDPSTSLSHYIEGTKEEYDTWNMIRAVVGKADKGQEVENAIELNDSIKYYINKLIRDNDFDLKSNLLEIALDNTNQAKQNEFNNNMKIRKAYIRMLDNIDEFERDIAIATNSDPSHPVHWLQENDFVNILSHIAQSDKPRWLEITKILKVEETYEPTAVKDEYIKLQQIVNSRIQPVTDGQIVNSIVNGGT